LLLMLLLVSIGVVVGVGVGVWGINIPVAWGFAIVNFVWWIGIGHAGTLISAILLLLHQKWRTSINRFAEAMTLFAVACAGLFPLAHLGRPWFFYWLLPYPNTMQLWPQYRSPLVWDVFAVSTYATVSLLFWCVGLIPAMVLTLAIPLRALYRLHDFITGKHLENMAKVMLATGLMVAYGYAAEGFTSWYSADSYETFMSKNRLVGPYAPVYWSLLLCNIG